MDGPNFAPGTQVAGLRARKKGVRGDPSPSFRTLFPRLRKGQLRVIPRWTTRQRSSLFGGFGHRIYKVRDPRALVLERAAEGLLEGSPLLSEARAHEAASSGDLERVRRITIENRNAWQEYLRQIIEAAQTKRET